jgi:hypothetical protein
VVVRLKFCTRQRLRPTIAISSALVLLIDDAKLPMSDLAMQPLTLLAGGKPPIMANSDPVDPQVHPHLIPDLMAAHTPVLPILSLTSLARMNCSTRP